MSFLYRDTIEDLSARLYEASHWRDTAVAHIVRLEREKADLERRCAELEAKLLDLGASIHWTGTHE